MSPPGGVPRRRDAAPWRRALAALLLQCALRVAGGASSNATLLRGAALEHTVRHWRDAEYALQAGERRLRLLEGALKAKATDDETSLDKLAYGVATPEPQLAAERNATLAAVEALKAKLPHLRAAVDAVWPPGEEAAVLRDDELPPDGACSAARLRHGARPHPTSPLPPNAFTRRHNISFLVQYFRHPANLDAIVDTLYACTHGSAYGGPVAAGLPPGTTSELIVNVDSRGDGSAWDAAVNRTAAGSFLPVLLSNNVHEVHGYNRAAAVARGEVLVLLQDDVLPPSDCRWVADLLARFNAFPRLGAVGLNNAEFWTPPPAYQVGGHNMMYHMTQYSLMYRHQGVPFQFVTAGDYGPFALRASAFAAVGGLDEAMAAPGDCGIVTDYELSLRFWTAGWQVGHMQLRGGMRPGVGVGGTHANQKTELQCWRRQITVNLGLMTSRYTLADSVEAFRQVRELNARLEAAFDGPPLWDEHGCCGGEGVCDPCGKLHNGFVDP